MLGKDVGMVAIKSFCYNLYVCDEARQFRNHGNW